MSERHEAYIAAASELAALLEGLLEDAPVKGTGEAEVEVLRRLVAMVEAFRSWAETHINADATATDAFDSIQRLFAAVLRLESTLNRKMAADYELPVDVVEGLLETMETINERHMMYGVAMGVWLQVSTAVRSVLLLMADHANLGVARHPIRWALFRDAIGRIRRLVRELINEIGGYYLG